MHILKNKSHRGKAINFLVPIALCLSVFIIVFTLSACNEHEHSFGDWEILTEATCEEAGLQSRVCAQCGEKEVATIAPIGHSYVTDDGYAASCTAKGLTSGVHCENCEYKLLEQKEIPIIPHSYVVDESVSAACTHKGLTVGMHCEICHYTLLEQAETAALSHTEVIDDAIAPTCTEVGYTAGSHCSVCNTVLTERTEIPALSHSGELLSVLIENVDGISHSGLFFCNTCHEEYYDEIKYEDINIPIIDLYGTLPTSKADDKVPVTVRYKDSTTNFECDATLKVQGATSSLSMYPKKNYNIVFYKSGTSSKNKVKLVEAWGKQSKYCLKANYNDYSQARNVVSGKLYNQVVHSREALNDEIGKLSNGGVVDGYPVLIYSDGQYLGLYTLNIPKDDWMFGMDDDKGSGAVKQAVLSAGRYNAVTALKENIDYDYSNGMELEFCSTEKTIGTGWVADSFNAMLAFINNNDGQDFIDNIRNYVNVERTIDSLIFTALINGIDNYCNNILWFTYDGVTWFSNVYDMDNAWGVSCNGITQEFNWAVPSYRISKYYEGNMLWQKIYSNFYNEIVQRYRELRQSVLSLNNIDKEYVDFFAQIPGGIYDCERQKWTDAPEQDNNNLSQIIAFTKARLAYMDNWFGISDISENVYMVNFVCDEGVTVKVFCSQDYTLRGDTSMPNNLLNNYSMRAFARDGDSGYLLANGKGQVNFEISLQDGYELVGISVNGNYNALKDPNELSVDNMYRITKISGDLTVTVSVALKE